MPTTDPSDYPEKGAQLPMAGHKGYGLAVMVEILTAVLTGAAVLSGVKSWVLPMNEPTDEGHAFIVIDIRQMMPLPEFKARMDGMIREIKAAPLAKGAERIYMPGEIELEPGMAPWSTASISPRRGRQPLRVGRREADWTGRLPGRGRLRPPHLSGETQCISPDIKPPPALAGPSTE